jgi:hypothetical protein
MVAGMPAGPSRRISPKKSKKGAPPLRPAKAKKLSEKQQKEALEREAQAYVGSSAGHRSVMLNVSISTGGPRGIENFCRTTNLRGN